MFACEFPACFQPNALQKRYSERSPVGLFALRVTPRRRSSSPIRVCRSNNSGTVSVSSFIGVSLHGFLRAFRPGHSLPGVDDTFPFKQGEPDEGCDRGDENDGVLHRGFHGQLIFCAGFFAGTFGVINGRFTFSRMSFASSTSSSVTSPRAWSRSTASFGSRIR